MVAADVFTVFNHVRPLSVCLMFDLHTRCYDWGETVREARGCWMSSDYVIYVHNKTLKKDAVQQSVMHFMLL